MITRFLVIAALMVLVALACALVPMLRSARREGRPRMPFVIALVLALATPPAVFGLYLAVGTPQALQAAPVADHADHADLVDATRQLQASLAKKPDDARGWALLAQAYSGLGEPQQALDALNHLARLQPDNPDVLVAWVEATAESNPAHHIDDASRAKLEHALQIDPTHQRALWLLGISDYQRGQYADATRRWKTLLPLLQPGSKVATAVQQQLADAEARARGGSGNAPAAATAESSGTPVANAGNVALNVTVRLAPALQDRLRPGDSLYVFARAVDGPPMPLAVARLHPSRLPVQVTLTNDMAINPALDLSKFTHVEVAARISRSGDAMPAAGDLESAAVEVATSARTPIDLTIDKVD